MGANPAPDRFKVSNSSDELTCGDHTSSITSCQDHGRTPADPPPGSTPAKGTGGSTPTRYRLALWDIKVVIDSAQPSAALGAGGYAQNRPGGVNDGIHGNWLDAMTAGTEVFVAGRGEHVVLFYRDEQELAERVSEHLRPAVQDGGLAIVAATPGHRQSAEQRLAEAGVDVAAACERGCYLAFDASETIHRFMVAGRPDPASFWLVISPLLQQAPTAGRPVRVFGEMVALLWDAGQADAAIELEAMWNELGRHYPFSLLCAYPAQPVSCAHHLDALTEVCRVHTQVISALGEPQQDRPHGL